MEYFRRYQIGVLVFCWSLCVAVSVGVAEDPVRVIEKYLPELPAGAQEVVRDKINQSKGKLTESEIIAEIAGQLPPGDVVGILSELDKKKAQEVLRIVDPEVLGEVLGQAETLKNLPSEIVGEILENVPAEVLEGLETSGQLVEILQDLDPGDVAEVLGVLNAETALEVLDSLSPEKLKDIVDEAGAAAIGEILDGLPLEAIDQIEQIKSVLNELPVGVVADILEKIPAGQIVEIFDRLPMGQIEAIAEKLPVDVIAGVISEGKLPIEEVTGILEALPAQAAAGVLEKLPINEVAGILTELPQNAVGAITDLLPDDVISGIINAGTLPSEILDLLPSIPDILSPDVTANQMCAVGNPIPGLNVVLPSGIESAIDAAGGALDLYGQVIGKLSPILNLVDALGVANINIPSINNVINDNLNIPSIGFGGLGGGQLFGLPLLAMPLVNPLECKTNTGEGLLNDEQYEIVDSVFLPKFESDYQQLLENDIGEQLRQQLPEKDYDPSNPSTVSALYTPVPLPRSGGEPLGQWVTNVVDTELSALLKCNGLGPLSQFDEDCVNYNFGEVRCRPWLRILWFCIPLGCQNIGVGYNQPKKIMKIGTSNAPWLPEELVDVLETALRAAEGEGDRFIEKLAIWMNVMTMKNETAFSIDDFLEFKSDQNVDDILEMIARYREDHDLNALPHEFVQSVTVIPDLAELLPGGSWLVNAGYLWTPLIRGKDEDRESVPSIYNSSRSSIPDYFRLRAREFHREMLATKAADFNLDELKVAMRNNFATATMFTRADQKAEGPDKPTRWTEFSKDSTGFTECSEYQGDFCSDPRFDSARADGTDRIGVAESQFIASDSYQHRWMQAMLGEVGHIKYEVPFSTEDPLRNIRCTPDFRDYCPRGDYGACQCEFNEFNEAIGNGADKCTPDSIINLDTNKTWHDIYRVEAFEIDDDLANRIPSEWKVDEPYLWTHRTMDCPHWPDARVATAQIAAMAPFDFDALLLALYAGLACGVDRCDADWKYEPAPANCESTGLYDSQSPLSDGHQGCCG